MSASTAVAGAPIAVKMPNHSFFCPRRSANAPSQGASSMTMKLALELVSPR